MSYKLSIIITAKDKEDSKLTDLIFSISRQTFRNFETIVVTEGDSESAKAIGLRRATGQYVCILASDNYLNDTQFFERCLKPLDENKDITGSFPFRYFYNKDDDILNRYFSLFGVNDPIPLFLNKNDKAPYYADELLGYPFFLFDTNKGYVKIKLDTVPTLGDNGFFIRRDILLKADIDHYFHIDVCQDLYNLGYKKYAFVDTSIWHRTGGNIFKFFAKRMRYADKFAEGRRWHMVDKGETILLVWFILSTLTLIYPLYLSFKGYKKIKDIAWFLHLPICLITIGVYGIWVIQCYMKKLYRKQVCQK